MNLIKQKGLWCGESGAAISEFLIVAPILMLMLYAVFDLNDRIELRQNLQIAARNVAHGGPSINADASLTKDFSKSLIEVQATSVNANSLPENKDRIEANLKEVVANDSYETASSMIGPIVFQTAEVLQGIKGLSIKEEYLLIPDQPESYTVSLKSNQETMIQRGMRLLSNSFAKKADDIIGEQTFLIDNVTMTSIRNEAGYHASKYMYQALPGIFLGQLGEQKHWGDHAARDLRFLEPKSKGYTPDCQMYFMGNSNCKMGNSFAASLRVTYIVVGIIKAIVSFGSDSASAPAINVAAEKMGEMASNLLVEEVRKQAVEMASAEIKNKFDEGGLEEDFKNRINDKVSDAAKGVSEEVMKKGAFTK